jgi:hypothetical protein
MDQRLDHGIGEDLGDDGFWLPGHHDAAQIKHDVHDDVSQEPLTFHGSPKRPARDISACNRISHAPQERGALHLEGTQEYGRRPSLKTLEAAEGETSNEKIARNKLYFS